MAAARRAGDVLPTPRSTVDYGAIGNLQTVALVSRFGSIDWACLPQFASPSVFGRLLDAERGGHTSITPTRRFRSEQEYHPSSNVLDTRFVVGRATLTVTDFMPVGAATAGADRALLVRIARATGGPVPIRFEFAPRFDYARRRPRFSRSGSAWVARASGSSMFASVPFAASEAGGTVRGNVVVAPGRPIAVELGWGDSRAVLETPHELLAATDRFWSEWVHPASAPFHRQAAAWHEWVERSELVLKLLSQRDTGAFIAAPTTSLPEWPGGSRNWDYRYAWTRDAAFSAQAMLRLGHLREASALLRWVFDRHRRPPGGRLKVAYEAHDGASLREATLPHLAGYRRSRPVRVGNAASEQFQLDIFGEVMDAASVLADLDPEFAKTSAGPLDRIAEDVVRTWELPDHGIWEFRTPPLHYVHSKVMAWVALDRASTLAARAGERGRSRDFRREADRIREVVLERGVDPRTGAFVQAFGSRSVDAANLRIPLVGFVPPTDDRATATLQRVDAELTRGPFVYRYRGHDGLPGHDASFLPCGFWRVECLARSGRRDEAEKDLHRLLRAASPLKLLSEEYDPGANEPLGNYPQAISHIGLLRAIAAVTEPTPPRSVSEPAAAGTTAGRAARSRRPATP